MAISNVRARTQSIKLLDVVNLDSITEAQASSLEAQGLCLWLRPDTTALVIPLGAYDKLCDLIAEGCA